MNNKIIIASCVVFLIAACSEQMKSILPTIENTSTVISIETSLPTSIPSVRVTPKPTLSLSRLATRESVETQVAQKELDDCNGYLGLERGSSVPNSVWRLVYCVYSDTKYPYTKLIKNDDSKAWEVPFYDLYGITQKSESRPNGIIDGSMAVEYWSLDNRYAYMKPVWCCIDGPGLLFHDVWALYRLDLETGTLAEILSPSDYAIAFSPNGKYLAYIQEPDVVHVISLDTGQEKMAQIGNQYSQAGLLVWSDNGEQLLIVGAKKDWEENIFSANANTSGFSLLLLRLDNMELSTLIDNDTRLIRPVDGTWLSDTELLLNDFTEKLYMYDILSHELTLETATQTPNP